MYKFKTLHCYHCNSVILNMPEAEVIKLDGLNFICEICGHQNVLSNYKFFRGIKGDPLVNAFSFENVRVV